MHGWILHPYIGLRAEDTVDTFRFRFSREDGQPHGPSPRERFRGVIVAVGKIVVTLRTEDGEHVEVPLTRLRLIEDDVPEMEARLKAMRIHKPGDAL